MATQPTPPAPPVPPPFIDNPNVAETFVDSLQTVGVGSGVIMLTFGVTRTEEGRPPKLTRSTAARLVLTLSAAVELHQKVGAVLNALQQQIAQAQAAVASAPTHAPAPAAKK